jgi:hypothetical protein
MLERKREREREIEKREKIKKHHYLIHIQFIHHLVNAHVFLHVAHHSGGPMQLATTFYFVCTYGEWHELAKF